MSADPDLATRIRVAERLDDLGAEIVYRDDPAYDRRGRRPFPTTDIYRDESAKSRIVLHAFRQEAGRSVLSHARTLPPATGRFSAHLHRDFEEHWLVYSGRARYRLGRERGVLEAGDKLVVPPGTPHTDPFNDFDEPVELLGLITPPNRFAFVYGRTLGEGLRTGTLNGQQQLHPLHLMLVLHETKAGTFAAGPPVALQRRVVIPLLAALARLRGFKVATW